MDNGLEQRINICKELGLGGIEQVYKLVVEGASRPASFLQQKHLSASILEKLGYSSSAMTKLKYSQEKLHQLGYMVESTLPASLEQQDDNYEKLRKLVTAKTHASKLKELGFTIHHCRTANCTPTEVEHCGFSLAEQVQAYTLQELKRGGNHLNALKPYFSDHRLKEVFTAVDFKNAGRSAASLKGLFPDNHIVAAGYPDNELAMAGLPTHTVDKHHLQY